VHQPGVLIIEVKLHQPFELQAQLWVEYGHHCLHPAIEVAGHPVGAAQKQLSVSAVGEPEQP